MSSPNDDSSKDFITPYNSTNFHDGVSFSHQEHAEEGIDCFTCHHTDQNKEEIQACRTCHNDTSEQAINDPEGYYQAWHSKTSKQSCVGCHQTVKDDIAPKTCKSCHLGHEREDRHSRHDDRKYRS
ncbi:cytochrome c class III [Maridesulfovibrio salexigens DSM 2638]|uniref:Cytochrome c class III n=2 Tax=Maridesulfovibrio salexigens TaxID=880 RepID=C6BRK7_MARSD|nr:cytochrome c class III [Maridesulfovibrio salexigens DSM 2638]